MPEYEEKLMLKYEEIHNFRFYPWSKNQNISLEMKIKLWHWGNEFELEPELKQSGKENCKIFRVDKS